MQSGVYIYRPGMTPQEQDDITSKLRRFKKYAPWSVVPAAVLSLAIVVLIGTGNSRMLLSAQIAGFVLLACAVAAGGFYLMMVREQRDKSGFWFFTLDPTSDLYFFFLQTSRAIEDCVEERRARLHLRLWFDVKYMATLVESNPEEYAKMLDMWHALIVPTFTDTDASGD